MLNIIFYTNDLFHQCSFFTMFRSVKLSEHRLSISLTSFRTLLLCLDREFFAFNSEYRYMNAHTISYFLATLLEDIFTKIQKKILNHHKCVPLRLCASNTYHISEILGNNTTKIGT